MRAFFSTIENPWLWYRDLDKSPWTPPAVLFPFILPFLNFCTGLNLYTYLYAPAGHLQVRMVLYVLLIALQCTWVYYFFRRKDPETALRVLLALWALTVYGMVFSWRKVSRWSGMLLVPATIWLSFIAYLNAYIVRHNVEPPKKKPE